LENTNYKFKCGVVINIPKEALVDIKTASGILFAAFLKLLSPIIVVLPGIIAACFVPTWRISN
jgi:uncharacterized sodium:solute symporter family permease YidK